MNTKKTRFISILFAFALSMSGVNIFAHDTQFRSLKLKHLVSALHLNIDTLHDGINTLQLNNRPIRVKLFKQQVVSVGYELFPEELKAAAKTPIMDFLERYFLLLDYPEADRPRDRMMREDRFKFEKGNLSTVASLRSDDAFSFNYQLRRYEATWSRDGQPLLSVSFPAEHELLCGENKIETENNVEVDIITTNTDTAQPVNENYLSKTAHNDNYYVKKGSSYLHEQLTSTLYYQREEGSYKLLSDVSHPLESAANLMLSPATQSDCQLRIHQLLYGNKRKDFEVPLRNWISYCLNNGCELYFGPESLTGDAVKASVIAVNNAENYNHVLFVNIPLSTIEQGKGVIEGRLETFIPMHNVRDIFAKYKKNKKVQPKIYQ